MRKSLILLLLVALLFLFMSGCSLPVKNGDGGGLTGSTAAATGSARGMVKDANTGTAGLDGISVPASSDKTEPVAAEKPATTSVTLYYQDADGYIVPVTRKVARQDGIARMAVGALIDNALNRESLEYYGLYPVLPKGTEIRGISIKQETAWIDFNEGLLNYDNEQAERNIIASVVYTLTEFKTIRSVRISVGGNPLEQLKFHPELQAVLDRKNTLVNAAGIQPDPELNKLDLYYFKKSGAEHTYLIPVSLEVDPKQDTGTAAAIVRLLSDGPGDKKLYTELPANVRLRSGEMDGKTLALDFKGNLGEYGGNAREEGILQQLLYSMKQVQEARFIRITFDGKVPELSEGSDVSQDIPLPVAINEVMDP